MESGLTALPEGEGARRLLYIGYGIDEAQQEAVAINALLYRRVAGELGWQCEVLAYHGKFWSLSRILCFLRRVVEIARNHSNLIVHDFFATAGFSLLLLLWLRARRVPLRYVKTYINPPGGANLTTTYGLLRLFNNRAIYWILAQMADAVTYIRKLNVPHFHLLPVPLRYEPGQVARHDEPVRIVYLGHSIRLKGVQHLPHIVDQVFASLPGRAEFHLSFSRHWPLPGAIQRLSSHPICTIRGEVDPAEFFAQGDIFLLPIRDGFAASGSFNTIWEAMACGCCVVTVHDEQLPEPLNVRTAELLDSPTASRYGQAIIELIRHPQRLLEKRDHALKTYAEYYEEHRHALPKSMTNLYAHL